VPKNKLKRILIASMFWMVLGLCQTPQGFLAGRIEPIEGSGLDLFVEVRNVTNHMPVGRESVGTDGSFHFRDLAAGSYEVRVVRAINNQILVQDVIEVNPLGAQVVLHIPRTQEARPVSGLVSVRELQSRVPKKAYQAFVKAQHYAETARPAEAIGQLRRAIALDPDWRDAHVNLGAELMKVARYEEGLAELQEAIRIGPATAMIYTNYAAGLATVHRAAEGEKAAREALRLDASFWRAHYLLGHILATQPGREKEALDHLHAGATEVPSSRIVAAQVLFRAGNRPGALAELREYLKSGDRTHRAQVQQSLAELERK
jgi:tetratricopeptide (TPR) repeat protein